MVDTPLCVYLWGDPDVDWAFQPAVGNSGGILSLWSATKCKLKYSFSGNGFLGVCMEWLKSKESCVIVNIYSPCNLSQKRGMWKDLVMSKKGFGGRAWCVVGDFNAVKMGSERRGVRNNWDNNECTEFQSFIDELDLIDLPMLGKRFNWFKPDGSAMSRLDRFLILEGWLNLWHYSTQWVGKRDVFDHCPIMLRGEDLNWGPKPFQFNNCWLQHQDFDHFVLNAWSEIQVRGWKTFAFKEKLKLLKVRIKKWNLEVFGNLDAQIIKLVDKLKEFDELASIRSLDEEELKRKKEVTDEMWKVMSRKESLLFQKSRSQWLKEGDSNSAFFHASVNMRRRQNRISAL